MEEVAVAWEDVDFIPLPCIAWAALALDAIAGSMLVSVSQILSEMVLMPFKLKGCVCVAVKELTF